MSKQQLVRDNAGRSGRKAGVSKASGNTSVKFKPSKQCVQNARQRAGKIYKALEKAYPDARCALVHKGALQLLVATILSAQCTDERVNKVCVGLFKKYRKAADFANAQLSELEDDIRSTGFFRNKARNIKVMCEALIRDYGGRVPGELAELIKLPGVGRKTANVVLGDAFGVPGITTDTHVIRLSRLMGLSLNTEPFKLEQDLQKLIQQKNWTRFSHLMIFHGRRVCVARRPVCDSCPVSRWCCFFQSLVAS